MEAEGSASAVATPSSPQLDVALAPFADRRARFEENPAAGPFAEQRFEELNTTIKGLADLVGDMEQAGNQQHGQITARSFKDEVAEIQSNLLGLKELMSSAQGNHESREDLITQGSRDGQVPFFEPRPLEASVAPSTRSLAAEGTSEMIGQQQVGAEELFQQTTKALEVQLLNREVEAECLRAELLRRAEIDGQEVLEQALPPEPSRAAGLQQQAAQTLLNPFNNPYSTAGPSFGTEQTGPLWHELQQVKGKVSMLAKQLSQEKDQTFHLEQETRRMKGFAVEQAVQNGELQQELRAAARNLQEVVNEYQQQWAVLTQQVDILERHSLLCMPDMGFEDNGSNLQRLSSSPAVSLPQSSGGGTPPISPLRSPKRRPPSARQSWPPTSAGPAPAAQGLKHSEPRRQGTGTPPPRRVSSPEPRARRAPQQEDARPFNENLRRESSQRARGLSSSRSPSNARVSSPSRRHQTSRPSRSPSPNFTQIDEVDEMWYNLLQNSPEHHDMIIVKERPGVYRLGSASGRAIMAKVSYAGLQVRVGGGWEPAEAFLKRYSAGLLGHSTGSGDLASDGVTVPRPLSPRLLSPTKAWANRVGLPTAPDFRESRESQLGEHSRFTMSSADEESVTMATAPVTLRVAQRERAQSSESHGSTAPSPVGAQVSSVDRWLGFEAEAPPRVTVQVSQPTANDQMVSPRVEGLGKGTPAVKAFVANPPLNGLSPRMGSVADSRRQSTGPMPNAQSPTPTPPADPGISSRASSGPSSLRAPTSSGPSSIRAPTTAAAGATAPASTLSRTSSLPPALAPPPGPAAPLSARATAPVTVQTKDYGGMPLSRTTKSDSPATQPAPQWALDARGLGGRIPTQGFPTSVPLAVPTGMPSAMPNGMTMPSAMPLSGMPSAALPTSATLPTAVARPPARFSTASAVPMTLTQPPAVRSVAQAQHSAASQVI